MKDGAGSLNFGQEVPEEEANEADHTDAESPNKTATGSVTSVSDVNDNTESRESDTETSSPEEQFPYFVRRSNVGDERDIRIEIYLREAIHDREAAFRNELAAALESAEISKTDAREFALKYAFENPEGVAEMMREDGYGLLD